MIHVDELANEIRRVDAGNKLGAGALAEALLPFIKDAMEGYQAEHKRQMGIQFDQMTIGGTLTSSTKHMPKGQ